MKKVPEPVRKVPGELYVNSFVCRGSDTDLRPAGVYLKVWMNHRPGDQGTDRGDSDR